MGERRADSKLDVNSECSLLSDPWNFTGAVVAGCPSGIRTPSERGFIQLTGTGSKCLSWSCWVPVPLKTWP